MSNKVSKRPISQLLHIKTRVTKIITRKTKNNSKSNEYKTDYIDTNKVMKEKKS